MAETLRSAKMDYRNFCPFIFFTFFINYVYFVESFSHVIEAPRVEKYSPDPL